MQEIDEEVLQELYGWVDTIPLSRPKKNIARDFSDGVLVAEVVHHFLPDLVEIHNYTAYSSVNGKRTNWQLLNRKVFKKLDFQLASDVIDNIIQQKPNAIEQALILVQRKVERFQYERRREKERNQGNASDRPEVDQDYRGLGPHQDGGRLKPIQRKPVQASQSNSGNSMGKSRSLQNLQQSPGMPDWMRQDQYQSPRDKDYRSDVQMTNSGQYRKEMVPKLWVEEAEQEVLAKNETIEILKAKVRRLEHLLHLKDIRIDDLQSRVEAKQQEFRIPPAAPPLKFKQPPKKWNI